MQNKCIITKHDGRIWQNSNRVNEPSSAYLYKWLQNSRLLNFCLNNIIYFYFGTQRTIVYQLFRCIRHSCRMITVIGH